MTVAKSTIHIIDDDASVRRALGRVMTQAGLDWKEYESAEAFMATAQPESHDCIVADLTMTGMSGLDLKHHLNAAGHSMPMILLTAHDTGESRIAARDAGAAAYFRKPVDIQALLDSIHWALHEPTPGGAA